jgi:hypothetical protein
LFLFVALSFGNTAQAQEKSLADIARETREKKAQNAKPTKVITTEDFSGVAAEPVKPTDDPIAVVKRAGMALARDTQHICQSNSSGNSGPGWEKSQIFQVAGQGRQRLLTNDNGAKDGRLEYVVINGRVYMKSGGAAWQSAEKNGWNDTQLSGMLASAGIPDELKFGYSVEQLKFVRVDTIAGSEVLEYESLIHTYDMERTIRVWIGANDGMLYRSEMTTRGIGQGATSWRTSTTCSYGTAPQIEAPI